MFAEDLSVDDSNYALDCVGTRVADTGNHSGLRFGYPNGCHPEHFSEALLKNNLGFSAGLLWILRRK